MSIYSSICNVFRAFDGIGDKLFRGGCDFSGRMTQGELGFSEEQGNEYQPVMGGFAKVLRNFTITNQDAIIDIGCGKGKAMWIFSKHGFNRVGGYDIASHLVEVANENFAKVGLSDRCIAEVGDAMTYDAYDQYNYFFLNNSVPEVVFESMIKNIVESAKRNPRKCVFIYGNQTCSEFLMKNTSFRPAHVYKSFLHYVINYTPVGWLCSKSERKNYFTYVCYEMDTTK